MQKVKEKDKERKRKRKGADWEHLQGPCKSVGLWALQIFIFPSERAR